MTCRELVDFLEAYQARELASEPREAFDAHLAECPDCRRYLQSYRATVDLAARAMRHPDEEPPAEVPEALVKAVLAARKLVL